MTSRRSTSSSRVDPIYTWLQQVNKHVTPGVGVEMLKLALYPFIKAEYATAQELTKPSQVYHFLEKHFKQDKQKALQWFAHALSLQSGHGRYLVSEACQTEYEISLPIVPEDIGNELKFYGCITQICDKARDKDLEEKMKLQFSKKGLLDTNPQYLRDLPQTFFQLIQGGHISPENPKRLVRTLEKYQDQDYTARWCLFQLNDYLKSAGMPQITSMQGVTRDQLGPETSDFENPTATELSSDQDTISRRLKQGNESVAAMRAEYHGEHTHHQHSSPKVVMGGAEQTKSQDEQYNHHDRGTGSMSKLTTVTDSFNEDTLSNTSESLQLTAKRSSGLRNLCVLVAAVTVVIVAIIALPCGMIWKNVFIRPKFDGSITIYQENNMVIIGELDNYYHQQVKISSLPAVPLGDHVVEVHRFNSTCEDLPTTNEVKSYERSNISDNRNFIHQYLLPESTLNYTVTPSVETSGSDSVKGYVYITLGPELHRFNQSTTCQTSDCMIVDHKPFTDRMSVVHSYRVKRRGYHNFHTVSIVPQYQYSLALTINATTINVHTVDSEPVCTIQDKNGGDESCIIDLKFKIGKTCLAAYTKVEENTLYPYISLEAKVTKMQTQMVIVTTLVPSVTVTLIIIGCLFIICCCRKIKCRKSQYKPLKNVASEHV